MGVSIRRSLTGFAAEAPVLDVAPFTTLAAHIIEKALAPVVVPGSVNYMLVGKIEGGGYREG